MFCSKCGTQSLNGERFCKNCGCLLESSQQGQQFNNMNNQNVQMSQPINNMNQTANQQTVYNQQQMNGQYQNNATMNQKYVEQAVNPNMKKWAILSIVVPVAGIIWYWFIGLSFYLAIFIAAAGFGFAEKGKMANRKLATIGKVCNGILIGMAVVLLILQLIEIFAQNY